MTHLLHKHLPFTLLILALMIVVPNVLDAAPNFAATVLSDGSIKIQADDKEDGDIFGQAVAISGNTAVIGAPGDATNTGAAYIYVLENNAWTEQQKLTSSDGIAEDFFGSAVAISGDTIVVGAFGHGDFDQGAAYVFVRGNDNIWTGQQKLIISNPTGEDFFGRAVAISGDTIVVGAPRTRQQFLGGATYIFVRGNDDTWTQQQELTINSGSESDEFGISVAVSGDTLAATANGLFDRAVYVYVRGSNNIWTQEQRLTPIEDPNFIVYELALEGDTLAIGASTSENSQGSGYVYVRDNNTWSLQQQLVATDGQQSDFLGDSIALSGNRIILGTTGDDNLRAAAYVFVRNNSGTWIQEQKLTNVDAVIDDRFGQSVAIDGFTTVIGTPGEFFNGIFAEAAYVYDLSLPPRITGTFPQEGATNIPTTAIPSIVISEIVTGITLNISITCQPNNVSVTFSGMLTNTNIITFAIEPQSDLPILSTCTVTIPVSNGQDLDGQSVIDNQGANDGFYVFTFSTGYATDTNNDGIVSPADAMYVINRLGTNDPSADVNGDGTVTTADLQAIRDALGNSTS